MTYCTVPPKSTKHIDKDTCDGQQNIEELFAQIFELSIIRVLRTNSVGFKVSLK